MKVTVSNLPLRLCTAIALVLGVLSLFQVSNAQEDVAVLPGPGPVPGMLQERGPDRSPSLNVWVEAVFVELEAAAIGKVEEAAGLALRPPVGKVILRGEERARLLHAVREMAGARIVASTAVVTISGQQAQSEDVEELTYPTEYDVKEGKIIPGNWEQRDIGAILNVTPMIAEDGEITLVVMPELTMLSGWKKVDGTEVSQPILRTWNKTTTVRVPNRSSLVLMESPVVPFHHSQVLDPEAMKELARRGAHDKPSRVERESLRKLETIVPEIKFENAKLTEIVDFISREAGVNIVIDPVVFQGGHTPVMMLPGTTPGVPGYLTTTPPPSPGPPAGMPVPGGMMSPPPGLPSPGTPMPLGTYIPPVADSGITLQLRNVPLKEVLNYALRYKNLKWVLGEHAIVIVPAGHQIHVPAEFDGPKTILTLISARVVNVE
jgi:hypothetical protein